MAESGDFGRKIVRCERIFPVRFAKISFGSGFGSGFGSSVAGPSIVFENEELLEESVEQKMGCINRRPSPSPQSSVGLAGRWPGHQRFRPEIHAHENAREFLWPSSRFAHVCRIQTDRPQLGRRHHIEIEPDQHRQIKTLATFSGMTIKEFILNKTLGPQRDEAGDSTNRLMGSSKNAERLRQAIATPDSKRRVFESVEDLKDALGI